MKRIFVDEFEEFLLRVSNFFEMIVYWKRCESLSGMSLGQGDIMLYEAVKMVEIQKLIHSTEINVNLEYSQLISPGDCRKQYYSGISTPTEDAEYLYSIVNEIETLKMNEEFKLRVKNLMIDKDKY